MLERFYLRSCLTFKEVELELKPGLIVFSGPSGSGKSVLMRSLLASVGFADAMAEVSESTLQWQIDEASTGFVNEEANVFRQVKKEKVRYFINNQSVSKRILQGISSNHLRHLSLKDYSDFEQENLLDILDRRVSLTHPGHAATLHSYKESFSAYKKALHELMQLEEEEKRIVELKEFAAFELSKIDAVAPKTGEYEELIQIKRTLSQKEKSEEKLARAESIFQYEYTVSEALGSLDIDTAFFDDAMNELRVRFDAARSAFDDLEDVDVEELLDRLEQLSELKRRYGSIEEALEYREKKANELRKYENFEVEKSSLQAECDRLLTSMKSLSSEISANRANSLAALNDAVNGYLKQLYLEGAEFSLEVSDYGVYGRDTVVFNMHGASLEKISAGEFNRLRLALLAVKAETMESRGGVLMLDEIDANLSGEESMSVARVLRGMSRRFQIFVISHQPQLTSMGEQHFLVTKNEYSEARELSKEERIIEIARLISGETVSDEAIVFAREMLDSAQSGKPDNY